MMPACSHTGTPRHFHASDLSGSACLMSALTRASVSPRQSFSSLILASISAEGESPPFSSFAPLSLFFIVVAFFAVVVAWSLVHSVQKCFEVIEPVAPERAVEAHPVDQGRQRLRLGAVMGLAALAPVEHQTRKFENAQMLGQPGLGNAGRIGRRPQ